MLRPLCYAFARQYLMYIYYSKTLKQFAIPFCGQKRTCQSNFLNGIVIFFLFLSDSLRIKTDDERHLSDLPRTVKFPADSSEPNALFATQEYSPVS